MAKKFTREELDQIIKDYIGRLQSQIEIDEVILFGSYAKDTATPNSDIDLLIISKAVSLNKPKGANGFYLDQLVGLENINTSLEVIAVHPEKLNNPSNKRFFDEIISTGIQITTT